MVSKSLMVRLQVYLSVYDQNISGEDGKYVRITLPKIFDDYPSDFNWSNRCDNTEQDFEQEVIRSSTGSYLLAREHSHAGYNDRRCIEPV